MGQRARGHDEQRRYRGHDRRQYRRHVQAHDPRREGVLHHFRQHVLRPVTEYGIGLHPRFGKEVTAQDADADRGEIDQDGKQQRHPLAAVDLAVAANRDQPHEDLGRAQETQADSQHADHDTDVDQGKTAGAPDADQAGFDHLQTNVNGVGVAEGEIGHDRQHHQAKQHHRALEHVGPRRGEETAGNAIGGHHHESHDGAHQVIPLQKRDEGGTGGIDLRGDIDEHEEAQRNRRDHPQGLRGGPEAADQVVDYRQ